MSEAPIPATLAVDVEPFTDDELDEALDVIGDESHPPVPESKPGRFVADDDSAAEWAARKYAAEQSTISAVRSQATEWRERINDWEAAETIRARKRATFFEQHLIAYIARRRAESEFVRKDGTVDWRVKSVSLPSATLKSSRRSARVKVGESEGAEAAAVEWCEANGLGDAIKRSLLVSKLDGVKPVDGRPLTDDGEVVPGLAVEPESVAYKVVL